MYQEYSPKKEEGYFLQKEYKHQEPDTVQDLFDEIENLIDVPFGKLSDSSQYQTVAHCDEEKYTDFNHNQFHYENEHNKPMHQKQYDSEYPVSAASRLSNSPPADLEFKRPVLIESDSDEAEEDVQSQYNFSACHNCYKLVPVEATDTLHVAGKQPISLCHECFNTTKQTRPKSFTFEGNKVFSQFADKVKHSFTQNPISNQLLPPGKTTERRNSMPFTNQALPQQRNSLEPPSPARSRPSSRASSFIEDIKNFLAPLSRRTSRNSLHQDYATSKNNSSISVQQNSEVPKRKSSYNSLLEAISIYKPKSKSPSKQSYGNNASHNIQQDKWVQESDGQRQEYTPSFQYMPIRRKNVKKIESREERMAIYRNGYMECMQIQTELVPWIIKQTQKGPPDAWFGYVPPTREPKKILGIFKRKSKKNENGLDLRTQQLQLGDELLSKTTPMLYHRYSNSNLSRTPSNSSYVFSDQVTDNQEYSNSPSNLDNDEVELHEEYDDENYFDGSDDPNATFSPSPLPSPSEFSKPNTSSARSSRSTQPVSILKKKSSNNNFSHRNEQSFSPLKTNNNRGDEHYDDYNDSDRDYDDRHDNEYHDGHEYQQQAYYSDVGHAMSRHSSSRSRRSYQDQQEELYYEEPVRQPKTVIRSSSSSRGIVYVPKDDYYMERSNSNRTRRSHSNASNPRIEYNSSRNSDQHYPNPTFSHARPSYNQYGNEAEAEDIYHRRSASTGSVHSRRGGQHHYYKDDEIIVGPYDDEPEFYQHPPVPMPLEGGRRRKISTNSSRNVQSMVPIVSKKKQHDYYLNEWEDALDDLCDIYPMLDRHYVDDFLHSANGDFVQAKRLIRDMLVEIR